MKIEKDCKIPEPLNANERYLYAMTVRLDALCHMMSSLIEHIAKQDKVAVTENKVVEKIEVKEETQEAPKRTSRKRKA